MKVGDKVRYLNAIGEGVVTKIDERNIVTVLEDDGFETPILATELVVVEQTNQFNFATKQTDEEKVSPAVDLPKQKYVFNTEDELPEGEKLTLFFAFVPCDIKNLQRSDTQMFLVNESNYFIRFQMLTGSKQQKAHTSDTIEPQTKLYLCNIPKEEINDYEFIRFQGYAFKENRLFEAKPSIDVDFKLNTVDFYKLHKFKDNDFFEDKAMSLIILEKDCLSIENYIDAKRLQTSMQEKKFQPTKKQFAPPPKNEIIEIDLHIESLIDNFRNLSNADMLNIQIDKFNAVMRDNINKKGQKIVFIHGKGEGILKNELYNCLKKNYKKVSYQDASFSQYGFGATQITIH